MSTQHTPGRLRLFQVGDNLEFLCPATEDGESILTITHEGNTAFAVVLSDMNARRLAACWNACDGVPTELLEAYPAPFSQLRAQRDELLAALQNLIAWHDAEHNDNREAIDNARAVIAKATA